MSDPNEHIDLSQGLTQDVMLAYLNDTLSNGDRYIVEKHLLDHPFEAEAMEGMQNFSGFMAKDLSKLDSQLHERIAKDKKKAVVFWNRPLQIAAAITVLVISSWLIFSILDATVDTDIIVMEQQDGEDSNLDREPSKKAQPVKQTVEPTTDQEMSLEATKEVVALKPAEKEAVQNETLITKPNSQAVAHAEKMELAPKEVQTDDLDESEIEPVILADDVMESEEILMEEELEVEEVLDEVTIYSLELFNETANQENEDITIKGQAPNMSQGDPSDALTGRVAGVMVEEKGKMKKSKKRSEGASLRSAKVADTDNLTSEAEAFLPNRLLSGTIYDEVGEPLPGVTVTVKGTSYGTITDIDGQYELQSQSIDDMLLINFIGYVTLELSTKDSVTVDATMEADVAALEEIVVVGYGSKEVELTGYQAARPVDGFSAYKRYLKENIRYPQTAKDHKISGKVVVGFQVSPNGSLINLEIIKGLGYGCDEEAIRLIKQGPRWTPAKRNEEPFVEKVRVKVKFEEE